MKFPKDASCLLRNFFFMNGEFGLKEEWWMKFKMRSTSIVVRVALGWKDFGVFDTVGEVGFV